MYAYIVVYLAVLKAEKLTGCEGIQFAKQVVPKEQLISVAFLQARNDLLYIPFVCVLQHVY